MLSINSMIEFERDQIFTFNEEFERTHRIAVLYGLNDWLENHQIPLRVKKSNTDGISVALVLTSLPVKKLGDGLDLLLYVWFYKDKPWPIVNEVKVNNILLELKMGLSISMHKHHMRGPEFIRFTHNQRLKT